VDTRIFFTSYKAIGIEGFNFSQIIGDKKLYLFYNILICLVSKPFIIVGLNFLGYSNFSGGAFSARPYFLLSFGLTF